MRNPTSPWKEPVPMQATADTLTAQEHSVDFNLAEVSADHHEQ